MEEEKDKQAELKSLSRQKGGFQSLDGRKKAWPTVLGVDRYDVVNFREYQTMSAHMDENQVRCDVDRSLWSVDQTVQWNDKLRSLRRNSLYHIIRAIMSRNKHLHYYQGFHDVASVFLMVLEDDYIAFLCAEKAALVFFGDCMLSNFGVISEVMALIFPLLRHTDSDLSEILVSAGIEPYFVVSWLITWFSHDIKDLDVISRLFDIFLCSHPIFCLYMCAALVVQSRDELLKCDNDFASLHTFLVHLPKGQLDIEKLVEAADALFASFPPEQLLQSAATGSSGFSGSELQRSGTYFAREIATIRPFDGFYTWLQGSHGARTKVPFSPSALVAAASSSMSSSASTMVSSWGWHPWTKDDDGIEGIGGGRRSKNKNKKRNKHRREGLEASVFRAVDLVTKQISGSVTSSALQSTTESTHQTQTGYGRDHGEEWIGWQTVVACAVAGGAVAGVVAQQVLSAQKR